jgi:hypothetical protein
MNMQTNLLGRLRNTSLPLTNGLLPLFEAVVNSIHSIEERGLSTEQGRITVEIVRRQKTAQFEFEPKKRRGPDALEEIVGFKVTDNGAGFTAANMDSFQTLDSDYKALKGCRGVGRLLWLKAFRRVAVESFFADNNGIWKKRTFNFDACGVSNEQLETVSGDIEPITTIHLDGFFARYRESSRKTSAAIAESIFEHCLWYFVRPGSAPSVEICDDGETISLHDLYEKAMHSSAIAETVEIKNRLFELVHVRLRSSSTSAHVIAFCADNRLVLEEKLEGKLPGLHGRASDSKGQFYYACYVSSDFLNEVARPERTGFDIEENIEGLLKDTEISLSDIRREVIAKARDQLADHLQENLKRAKDRVEKFVSHKAPRYRPILSRIPSEQLNIDPETSDKDLDLTLHKHLAQIERELLEEGHEIMTPKTGEDTSDYQKRVADYLDKAEDIKKSDLANYVSHRKVILDLLSKAIARGPKGVYAREDLIHQLIMPMRKDSNSVKPDSLNLWLVDERLAFHDYLASDKTLASMPITGCKDAKEPDLCALNVFDNPMLVSDDKNPPLASIVIVEIKRPLRNDARAGEEDDPIEQALGYLERIRDGKVQTSNGRPIPRSEDLPGYCYIICDLTPTIEKRCKVHDLIRTADGLGYFNYKSNYKAYVEVISFDRLVMAAKQRNRAFFDKLGLPSN